MIKGRYTLERQLPQVRLGTLYRAIDTLESHDGRIRYVSLWVLPPSLCAQPAALAAFQRDFLRIRGLAHPSIARVFDLDRDGDTVFVTGEFVDGETLRTVLDHLRPERLSVAEADTIVAAIGAALDHAHERGIVHGEVRPENVLVTLDRRFKLANFFTTSALRTGAFAARPVDDVRDLAALAYELYTGEAAPPEPSAKIRMKGVPRSRAKAISLALGNGRKKILSARAFLKAAGIPLAPPVEPRSPGPRWSMQRSPRRRTGPGLVPIAVGALGVLAVAVGLTVAREANWFRSARIDRIDDWSKQVIQRWAAGMPKLPSGAEQQPLPAPTRPEPMPAPTTQQPAPEPVEPASAPALTDTIAPEDRDAPATVAATPSSVAPAEPTPSPETHPDPTPTSSAPDVAIAAVAPPPATPAAASSAGPARVQFAQSAVTAYEGRAVVAIEVNRSGDPTSTVEFVWWTSDGTAKAPDDYANFGRRVERFAPGETQRHIYVPITSDAIPEPDEFFLVHIDERVRGGRAGDRTTVEVTIVDDDL